MAEFPPVRVRMPSKSTTRRLLAVTFLVLVAGAIAWLFVRRQSGVPRVVRLLPNGQILAYVNLQPLRQAGLVGRVPVPYAPSYAAFIHASGFDFERDADAVALSIQGTPAEPHQTMVLLEAGFPARFFGYLKKQSGGGDQWQGHSLYAVHGPDGPLLILELEPDLIAVTNAKEPSAFAAVLARERAWWQKPAPAPDLYTRLGARQPSTALGWLVVDYASLASQQPPSGWMGLLRGSSLLLARVDADPVRGAALTLLDKTVLPQDSARIANRLRELLSLYLQKAASDPSADAETVHLLRKIQLSSQDNLLQASLTLPPDEVKALFQVAPAPANRAGPAHP